LPLVGKKDATPSRRSDRSPLDFPPGCRLLRRSDFQAVYRDGRRKSNQPFLIFIRPNGRNISRFGMSVKKAQGGAVLRNRIRRRVREIVRLHRQEIAAGWDIVIHPRSSAATADFPSLASALLDLLPKPTASPTGKTIDP
jgi:ribonuclease P protein component